MLKNNFPNKFVQAKYFAYDITNKDDQIDIVIKTHNRAHRGLQENIKQIRDQYYWPV